MRRIVMAVLAVLIAGNVSGCGTAVSGSATAGEVDVRDFDAGPYATVPVDVPKNSDPFHGRIIESIRIADYVVEPSTVDPDLHFWSGAEPRPDAASATGTLADATQAVLERYGMVAGYVVGGSAKPWPDVGKPRVGDAKALTVNVLRMRDEQAARDAAKEIDGVDFAISADNVAAAIPNHSDAHSHWRPTIPSLASTIAHDTFVVSIFAEYTTPDLDVLTKLVGKAMDMQLPLLDQFDPTPVDELSSLPYDPDNVIRRTLPTTRGQWPYPTVYLDSAGSVAGSGNSSVESGVAYSAKGALHSMTDKTKSAKLFTETGVEYLALVDDYTFLFRVRDEAGARRVEHEQFETEFQKNGTSIDAPKDVPEAKCYKFEPSTGTYFRCSLVYRNFAVSVWSNDERDVRQKAAAQYALLANTQ